MTSGPKPLFSPIQKLILGAIVLGAIGFCIYLATAILLPFFLSFVLAYLLNPVVQHMDSVFKKRILSVAVLYLGFTTLVIVGMQVIVPVMSTEIANLSVAFPSYLADTQTFIEQGLTNIQGKYPVLNQVPMMQTMEQTSQKFLLGRLKDLPGFILPILSILSYLTLVPFILFFFLLQGPEFQKTVLRMIPNKYFEMILNLTYRISSQLGSYLRSLLMESVLLGICTAIGLWFLDVDYVLILGALATFGNIIPYVGPVVAILPALVVGYVAFQSWQIVISILILFGVIQLLDNILLQPFLFSHSVDLHPVLILLVVLLGGTYGGIWGLVLAVPIGGVIKVVASQLYREIQFRAQIRLEQAQTI